jgi:hypothetical protein
MAPYGSPPGTPPLIPQRAPQTRANLESLGTLQKFAREADRLQPDC